MTKGKVLSTAAAMVLALTAFGVGGALADTYIVGYSQYANGFNGDPPLADRCFLIKVELRHPSISNRNTLDYNTYNRARSGPTCATAYSRPAGFLAVRGAFTYVGTISNPGRVCSSFGWVENNAATADFGIGAGVANPAAVCGVNGGGSYYASGSAWRIINGNKTVSQQRNTGNHFFP